MKYKLINSVTKIETICDKVTIDGFDYYVSDDKILNGDYCIHPTTLNISQHSFDNNLRIYWKKIIATNNPNIDIPKVVDEIRINKEKNQELIDLINHTLPDEQLTLNQQSMIYHHGIFQETHPSSEEDMIEFAEFISNHRLDFQTATNGRFIGLDMKYYTAKELLQLWREQKPKTVYYNE